MNDGAARPRLFDFQSGGWAVILAILVPSIVIAWRILATVPHGRSAVGDGQQVDSYGFDLSTCLVPRASLVTSGVRKDGMPAMVAPRTINARDLHGGARLGGVQTLVSSDRVIGVEVAGEARVYPIWILNWHEIINDTLGGVPIAVTYSPLCDSAVVFDRRVGGETLEFGVSGLLFNCNLVMFDRHPGGDESLWSQLQSRAISGAAAKAGKSLRILPANLVRWADWRARYPATEIILPDPDRTQLYKRDVYLPYFGNDLLRFPAEPLPPPGLPKKTGVVAVRVDDGEWHVWTLASLAKAADRNGVGELSVAGTTVQFTYHGDPATAHLSATVGSPALQIANSFWFAWYATHPGAELE
ncbi:MAG: DUF3179 domain-containing (seleno)protein [Phycisphaerae bacterium]